MIGHHKEISLPPTMNGTSNLQQSVRGRGRLIICCLCVCDIHRRPHITDNLSIRVTFPGAHTRVSIAAVCESAQTLYLGSHYCYLRQLYDVRTHGVEDILKLVYHGDKSLHSVLRTQLNTLAAIVMEPKSFNVPQTPPLQQHPR